MILVLLALCTKIEEKMKEGEISPTSSEAEWEPSDEVKEEWSKIPITEGARRLLERLNLACPMREKEKSDVAIYHQEGLNLGQLSEQFPLTALTLFSTAPSKVTPSVVITAFGGKEHIITAMSRLSIDRIQIGGEVRSFSEFMAMKKIHIGKEAPDQNNSALIITDVLTQATVEALIESGEGRLRAKLKKDKITLTNVVIPKEFQGQIRRGQTVLVHWGCIITPENPEIEEGLDALEREQIKNSAYQAELKALAGQTIDYSNFCPSEKEKGMDLAHYIEERL